MDRRFCAAAARARLDRGPHRRDRYRWAEGRDERFAEIATELVRLKVDVIVTSGTAVPAAKQATSVIPIVFAVATDPIGSGLVASLARPGGNVTGLSLQSSEIAGKRLGFLREVLPGLRRLAVIGNAGSPPVLEVAEVQAAAGTLGLEVAAFEIRRAEDVAPAFAALKDRAEALYVVAATRSYSPIGSASTRSRPARDCRRCTVHGNMSNREVLCPMDRITRICSGALATMSTRFSRGEARRPPGRAADQVRSRHQSQDRQGAWPDNPRTFCPRRRGDRMGGGGKSAR